MSAHRIVPLIIGLVRPTSVIDVGCGTGTWLGAFTDRYADNYINSLTRLAPVILFSAAIPFQGGSGHVNEQWPEYWVAKKYNYFARFITLEVKRILGRILGD